LPISNLLAAKVGAVTLNVNVEKPGTPANSGGCVMLTSVWPTLTGVDVTPGWL
jgi:hypothetical protein